MRDGWVERTLDSLAGYQNGYPFKPTEFSQSGLPVVRIKQLLDPSEPVDRCDLDIPTRYRIQTGDLIFAWSGTLAVRRWDRGDAWLNQHLFRVDPVDGVDARWLSVALNHALEELQHRTHGTTMKHITKRELSGYSIAVPPLKEQLRIFDLVDAVQQNTASAVRLAEASRGALLTFLRNALARREEHVPLRDLLEESVGGDWGGEPGSSDVDVPVYRQTEFKDDGTLKRPADALRSIRRTSLRRRTLRPGDVLMQKSAGTPSLPGRVVEVPEDIEKSAVPSNFLQLLRFDSERCEPRYAFWMLWAMHMSGRALAYQAGTNIRNLSVPRYLGVSIPAPARIAQREVVEVAQSLHSLFLRATDATMRIDRARHALMASLLSGEHEVPESYDALIAEATSA